MERTWDTDGCFDGIRGRRRLDRQTSKPCKDVKKNQATLILLIIEKDLTIMHTTIICNINSRPTIDNNNCKL